MPANETIPNFLETLFNSNGATEPTIVAAGERLLNHTKAVVEDAKRIVKREKADQNKQTSYDDYSRDNLEKGTIQPGSAVLLQMKERLKSLKPNGSEKVATKKPNGSVIDTILDLELAQAEAVRSCVIQPKLQKARNDGSAVVLPGVGVVKGGPKGISTHKH